MNSDNGTVHWHSRNILGKKCVHTLHCPKGRTSEFLIRRTNFRPTAVLIVVYKYVVIKKRNRLIAFFICSARVHTNRDGLRKSYCWWINCSMYKAVEKCLLAYSLFLIDFFTGFPQPVNRRLELLLLLGPSCRNSISIA